MVDSEKKYKKNHSLQYQQKKKKKSHRFGCEDQRPHLVTRSPLISTSCLIVSAKKKKTYIKLSVLLPWRSKTSGNPNPSGNNYLPH